MKKEGKNKKGQLKPGDYQPLILSFLTPAFAIFNSVNAATETMEVVNDLSTENVKKT